METNFDAAQAYREAEMEQKIEERVLGSIPELVMHFLPGESRRWQVAEACFKKHQQISRVIFISHDTRCRLEELFCSFNIIFVEALRESGLVLEGDAFFLDRHLGDEHQIVFMRRAQ